MKEPARYSKGENTYIIGTWTVDKSLEIFVWLTKTFGEGFVSIFMQQDEQTAEALKSGGADDVEAKVIEEFVSKIVDRLEPAEYTKYARKICDGIKCNGQDLNFNTHFMGRIGELHFLMFHALRHQYSDFLEGSESEG